jgi:protein-tyrosine kinase
MSRYARVLERIGTSASNPSDFLAGGQAEASSQHSAATLLPSDRAWRQELERLRSAILLAGQMQSVQVILMCGSRSPDGTTSVAVHLALALAEMDRTPVALADLGVSEPRAERYLKGALPTQPLKEVLPSGSSLSVLQTQIRNFYLIAPTQAGAPPIVPMQTLDLLRRLRERFKYVILNAPPVLLHPDTALLATRADGVVLIAQAGKSRLDELNAAKTEFERVGANILGVVLNQRKEHLPKLLADYI